MRIPTSTYRLQITEDFDLRTAARTLGYLHDLGVDWVYLSPLLASESGSDHGYDVADHSAVDPARGRSSGLSALSAEARRLGMGVLVDIVPNHVGVARPWENTWWWHVLTHGQDSPYAAAFDIDWEFGNGRVRIPVVGDDDLLPGGSIGGLRVEAGELHYHDQRFPLAPGTVGPVDDNPDAVHSRQNYELVSWRLADTELNYRRFFAVNTLVAIRVEDPEWFARSHEEVGRWFTDGLVDGLRIDHPDGLADPGKYLDDLAELTDGAYVLVEKILEPGEALPRQWATAGTTGYDALALIDRVLTDPAGEPTLTDLQARLRGRLLDWHSLSHDTKRAVADGILRSEVARIARDLRPLIEDSVTDPDDEPVAPGLVEDAIAELLAAFPVYRSYLPLGREHLDHAFASARSARPDLGHAFNALEPLLGDGAAAGTQRFQQTSGMVMAKGVEDCAFYRTSRLTSLNEVGGDPSVFAIAPAEFHEAMIHRQAEWPAAMTTATTHDTKRGEDVRARIAVLAELPDRWASWLERLLELAPVPEASFGNLLWQAVIGAWPASRERLHAYAEKAMREAGDRTAWTSVDVGYESAVHAAVDAAYDNPAVRGVLDEIMAAVVDAGWSNSLSAKLIGITMPGVPDVYQGAELWEQSLVDPDNRRPVDYDARRDLLASLGSDAARRPYGLDDPGAAKLLLTHRALTARRDDRERFTAYEPVAAQGEAAAHVLAFDRGGAVTVATRLPIGLAARGGWGDTRLDLPAGRWRDAVTGNLVESDGEGVTVADVLAEFPVALLLHLPEQPGARGRFDVWAPIPQRVTLVVGDRELPMRRGSGHWWTPSRPVDVPAGGVDYGYRLDEDPMVLPDPRSRCQPSGVHALSRTWEPTAFAWTDHGWRARPLAGSIIYELHIGTFTPAGTLDAAIDRLDHLVDLGVDIVELMPVHAFNGDRGWGYDGVAWWAVHEAYGGPEAYQRFVDACHARGLAVVQDVVHNHFGPSGNYLPRFGPYLKAGHSTWGDLINLDGEGSLEVRRFVLDSARAWFTDFHVDGLRLDAVHALHDESEMHLLEEMSIEIGALSAHLRRPLLLIAESDLNDAALVTSREGGGHGLDAQWSDDFHHALHVALTGETSGYYADFAALTSLKRVCDEGFFHAATWSSFRGTDWGAPIPRATLPAYRLIVCSQNHDQVGNRARGDRLTEVLDDDQLLSAALVTLAGPFTPMLFMGEEFAASSPFQFFSSHPEPELAAAVTEGRFTEFARMGWEREAVPDPQDAATFAASRLKWAEVDGQRGRTMLAPYQQLIALRRELPALTDPLLVNVACEVDEDRRTFVMRRGSGREAVVIAVNFSSQARVLDMGTDVMYAVHWATPSGATVSGSRLELPAHAGVLLVPEGSAPGGVGAWGAKG
ncbi:MAG: malto-oligosyltrehalose synthase [Tetrasphaera sp.]